MRGKNSRRIDRKKNTRNKDFCINVSAEGKLCRVTRIIYVSQCEDSLQLVSSMIAPNGIAYKYLLRIRVDF